MAWFNRSISLKEILEREEEALDEIFGKGSYSIEGTDADFATVRSGNLEWRVGYDRGRDRSIGSSLNLGVGEPWEQLATIETLAQFSGEETAPIPRNASGIVELSVEDQIALELKLLRRLSVAILANPQLTRDAALFVRGYYSAYTDYCSGSWDVA